MKFCSWNVNGIRACMSKGFLDSFYELDADFFCLQETKLQEGQIQLELPGYYQYWCYAQKKGYSGTAIFTKHRPLNVTYGVGVEGLDTEGRLITLEYEEFYLVNCYTPNAQRELARIEHRLAWEEALRSYLIGLDRQKPVIYCGDLNVAHNEIDLKNPGSNKGSAGFSDQERNAFSQLLDSGFIDSFRHLYPDVTGAYSWWSYMFKARQNNAGWRIDYFVVSDRLKDAISDATIHPDIMGSDHCPVGLDLDTTCNGSIWSPETKPYTRQNNDADREAPVGIVKKKWVAPLAIVCLLLVAILCTVLYDGGKTPEGSTPSIETPKIDSLITDIRYPVSPYKVSLIQPSQDEDAIYVRIGMEQWELVPPIKSLIAQERMPTFCAIIIFHEDAPFTTELLPQVQYRKQFGDKYFHVPYLTHQFFYDEDGKVGGFLLLGDVPEAITTTVTVRHAGMIASRDVELTPEQDLTDYTKYSTPELVELLKENDHLRMLHSILVFNGQIHLQTVNYDLEFVMKHDPAAMELATREDAVDAVFFDIENLPPGYSYPNGNLMTLLGYDVFQEQMSEEQRLIYMSYNSDVVQKDSEVPKWAVGGIISFGDIIYD